MTVCDLWTATLVVCMWRKVPLFVKRAEMSMEVNTWMFALKTA